MDYFDKCKKRIERAVLVDKVGLDGPLLESWCYIVDAELAVRKKTLPVSGVTLFSVEFNHVEVPLSSNQSSELYALAQSVYMTLHDKQVKRALSKL